MSVMSELDQKEEQAMLKQVTGKTKNIEINERTIEATKKAFRDKGLEVTKYTEYPREDYYLIDGRRNLTQ